MVRVRHTKQLRTLSGMSSQYRYFYSSEILTEPNSFNHTTHYFYYGDFVRTRQREVPPFSVPGIMTIRFAFHRSLNRNDVVILRATTGAVSGHKAFDYSDICIMKRLLVLVLVAFIVPAAHGNVVTHANGQVHTYTSGYHGGFFVRDYGIPTTLQLGGTVTSSSFVRAYDNRLIDISRGQFNNFAIAWSSRVIRMFGSDCKVGGMSVGFGAIAAQNGTLTGLSSSGAPRDVPFIIHTSGSVWLHQAAVLEPRLVLYLGLVLVGFATWKKVANSRVK